MGLLGETWEAFLLMIPAMVANGSAVLVRHGTPIDFRKTLWDGRRVLGDGKTFEGLLVALSFATIMGGVLAAATGEAPRLAYGFLAGLGAMLGDMAGSFVKRRLNLARGAPLPVVDQLDFVAGAALLLYLAGAPLGIYGLVLVSALILVLHRATNLAAHRLGLKDVPW